MRHLFPKTVSYNRFVELERHAVVKLSILVKSVLMGKCTGISFIDSTPLRVCKNQRILQHKTFIVMSVSDKVLLRKRAIIESVNDELKNMAQVEHSRHRSFHNFVNNLMAGLAAYCFFPKKPMLQLDRELDKQLTIF